MTLEEVPPGQVPTRMTPTASSGGRRNSFVSKKAMSGIKVNWQSAPITTSFGRRRTSVKSEGFSVSPIPNITTPSR